MPEAPALALQHWIYLAVTVVVIASMVCKRGVVIPCIVGTFFIGLAHSDGSLIFAAQSVFRSMSAAGQILFDFILIIALKVAMLKSLAQMGADQMMIAPAAAMIKSPTRAFWIIAGVMFVASSFFGPTPATALVGTMLIPVAVKAGLKPMMACMSLNIAGHGMALSGDIVIQGAPNLTAASAGIPVENVLFYGALFGATTGITALVAAFIINRKNLAPSQEELELSSAKEIAEIGKNTPPYAKYFAAGVPLVFLAVVIRIVLGSFDTGFSSITGGAATSLLGGAAALIIICATFADCGNKCLEKIVEHIREGFTFAIKIFAPVIPIAGFFLLGAPTQAAQILGEGARGLLFDLSGALALVLPLGTVPITVGMVVIAGITGLNGSGFATLPVTGALAASLAAPAGLSPEILAGLAQAVGIFVGGGTLPAWAFGVAAAAGVAGVPATDLVRKNFAPVMMGFAVSTVVAIILLQTA